MIRKIMTAEEKEKRDTKMKRLIGIILGLIMLLSSLGYAFMSFEREDSTASSVKYNGINFAKTSQGTWTFNLGDKSYETIYTPVDVANIAVTIGKNLGNYYNLPLYFGINSASDISSNGDYEIAKNLDGIIVKSQFACLNENCTWTNDYPLKNCNSDNIIIFKQSLTNISKVTENNKCVIIEYNLGEDQKAADAFIFKLLGIN
jgi:hypothetical protein